MSRNANSHVSKNADTHTGKKAGSGARSTASTVVGPDELSEEDLKLAAEAQAASGDMHAGPPPGKAEAFWPSFKRMVGLLGAYRVSLVVVTLAAVGVGRLLGLKAAMIAGAFAGAVTNTPALAAAGNAAAMAGDKAGPGDATVAYAVTYLYGVIGMLFFCLLALRYRRSDKDTPSPLINRTIRVEREDGPLLGNIVETISGQLRFSRLRRGEKGPITRPKNDDRLHKDDLITVVGTQDAVNQAIKAVGHGSSHSLIEDRKYLDFRRITVSDPKLAGRTIGELDIDSRFGATISRVRRGDVDMVGTPDLVLQQGDRVRVVGPTGRMKEISTYFGDSSRGLSSINPVALGLGMALGIFIGEWKFLTPTGATFSIGSAAGAPPGRPAGRAGHGQPGPAATGSGSRSGLDQRPDRGRSHETGRLHRRTAALQSRTAAL